MKKKIVFLLLCILVLFAFGCSQKSQETADLILSNGHIYTVDADKYYEGNATKVIDLKGQMVLPLFVEGHGHAQVGTELLYSCDILQRFGREVMSKHAKVFEIPSEEKRECEANIKRNLSNILKKHSGKGPTDIKVFIRADQIEITFLNALTIFELTLLQSDKNSGLVEHSRRVFYQMIREEMQQAVSREVGMTVSIKEISIDSGSNIDILQLVHEQP